MKEPAEGVVHTAKSSSVVDHLLITEGKGELNKRGGRHFLSAVIKPQRRTKGYDGFPNPMDCTAKGTLRGEK